VGLKYLHDKGFIHRDIKGGNILVDQYGRVKLSDFGAATKIASVATIATTTIHMGASNCVSFTGTAYWMAPEVIKQSTYGRKCDVWSVGCTVIEMLAGAPPWSHLQPVPALFQIASTDDLPTFPPKISPECTSFISRCLTRHADDRPTVHDLLKHPFITKRVISIDTYTRKELEKSEVSNETHFSEEKVVSEDKEDEEDELDTDSEDNSEVANPPIDQIGKIKSQPLLVNPPSDVAKREPVNKQPRKTLPITAKFSSEEDVLNKQNRFSISASSSRPRGRSTPEKPAILPKIVLPFHFHPKRSTPPQSSISIASAAAKTPTPNKNTTPTKISTKVPTSPQKLKKEKKEKKKSKGEKKDKEKE